jgi:hypothetical protein
MKSLLIIAAVAILASCTAAPPATPLYRDATGAKRGDMELKNDEAACDYEMRAMAYSRPYTPSPNMGYYSNPHIGAGAANIGRALANPSPGEGMYQSCMRARGWQLVGYE